MVKIAFIFPGQGAQYVGMGKDLYENLPNVAQVFDRADHALGFSIKDLCFEGPEEKLKETENTQPAILTMSIAIMEEMTARGIKPDVTAGLSLGEYASLVTAGALEFEDAVKLVKKRGKYMQEAVPLGVGTMAAIMGLNREDVLECCQQSSGDGIVEAANFNCPGQIVISGEIEAVEKAVEIAREKGARKAVVLPVSAPFHCEMLESAGKKLADALAEINVKNASIPVISNVNAIEELDSSQIADNLVKQVSRPVLWEDSVVRMLDIGVDIFIELGPGKTLTSFLKKINRNAKVYNVGDMKTLEKTLSNLEEAECLI